MTTYSTKYTAYSKNGGSLSGTISANSQRELFKKMRSNDHSWLGFESEVITFEGITKTTSTHAKRGYYIQLEKRISHDFLNGKKPSSRFYRRLA